MMKEGNVNKVWSELRAFKRRYYANQLLRGSLLLGGSLMALYFILNALEFTFRFGPAVRTVLFIFFVLVAAASIIYFILKPLLILTGRQKGMSDDEAARRIGRSFPVVSDRLLNLIQLQRLNTGSPLAEAGITQKTSNVSGINFKKAIHLGENKKYLKYFLSPVSLIALIFIFKPAFFSESTDRLIHFTREYVPEAPFSFHPEMDALAFKNEDYTLSLRLQGEAVPAMAYLIIKGRKLKLNPLADGSYQYTFKKIQEDKDIRFEAAGFYSRTYNIRVVRRPDLKNFNVQLVYPRYTQLKNERLSNTGHLEIPEGTKVNWQFSTLDTDSVSLYFASDSSRETANSNNAGLYELNKTFLNSEIYSVNLNNKYSTNRDSIQYSIAVIKDQYPNLTLNIFQDTVLFNTIVLGGNISDDYGLTRLQLHYDITRKGETTAQDALRLTLQSGQAQQGFYYQWALDSLKLEDGDQLSYYLQVWDNDGIHGHKSTKSGRYLFQMPTRKQIKDDIARSADNTEDQIDKTLEKARELEKKLDEAERKIKGKRELNWEDEKLLKEILEKREEINKELEELKELNKELNMKKERFSPQDQRIKEKARQLQQLMDDLLDEETRKLYEELQRLLDENSGVDQVQQMMDQINKKENNLEKELERSLELFKKLKLEREIEEAISEMEKLGKEQEELAAETLDKEKEAQDVLDKQKDLNERFDELKKELEKLREMNQELKNPESMPDQGQLEQEIEQEQDQSTDLLEEITEEKKGKEESGNQQQQGERDDKPQDGGEKKDENSAEESGQQEKDTAGEQQTDEDNPEDDGDSSGETTNEESQEKADENQKRPNEKKNRKQAGDSQQKAGQKMKQMAQELQQMQNSMEMEMMMENIDDLRNIVHNLLKLSFDQEATMKDLRLVNEVDPRFIDLSQQQLKLKDDARVIEDSLISLSRRIFQLSSFITREVGEMNQHMDNVVEHLKERIRYKAIGEQQFAMTSMNNLALLLDDVLQQMMNAMSDASGKGKSGKKQQTPSLSELQQQLNEQIKQLKESGKTGRQLSEELAKLAAEQERIRKAMEEMQRRAEEMNMDEGGLPGGDLPQQMEKTETELVNKKLTEQMIRRQEDILTRLLEAENAMRERELDEERKGETATQYDKMVPRAFEEYLKQKEIEIEMLKTLPPRLYPYYKREVTEYFKRIGETNN